MEAEKAQAKPDKNEKFINHVIKRCQDDKGWAAQLRRADNPATEYQSWDLLITFGIDPEHRYQCLPYITVAAAIARAKKLESNGKLGLGRAIADSYPDGCESDQAIARLRRLLACDDLPELCRHLRPLFSLIESRVAGQPLDYLQLLNQLIGFNFDDRKIKARWAREFYGQQAPDFGDKYDQRAPESVEREA